MAVAGRVGAQLRSAPVGRIRRSIGFAVAIQGDGIVLRIDNRHMHEFARFGSLGWSFQVARALEAVAAGHPPTG